MKYTAITLLAALTAFLTACSSVGLEPDRAAAEEDDALEACYDQGVVLVRFSEDMAGLISADLAAGNVLTKSSDLNSFVRQYGITSIERVFSDDPRWTERHRRAGLDRWYTVTFDKETITATRAADVMAAIPGVEIAEPSPKAAPVGNYYDDLYFSDQWYLHGTYDINVEPVWDSYTKGDPDVIVAVVDTGIDFGHEDLAGNLVAAGEGGSRNFYESSYSITGDKHGTHVAGIIAAVPDNGLGVAGIAGGDAAQGLPGTRLLNCQTFSGSSSCSSSGFAEAIKYGADNGALISQNSWTYNYTSESKAGQATTPAAVRTAIDYFAEYAGCDNDGNQLPDSKMKGGIVVFAAGNDGWRYSQPGGYETCIAVGATDSLGMRASYSNYGDWVDICAPGTAVMSCYNEGTYGLLNGTSMACPMVSGVAALVIAARGGYGFTADMLRECLISGADPDKVSAEEVGPYLDALGAVTYDFYYLPPTITPSEPVDDLSLLVSETLTVTFTIEDPDGHDFTVSCEPASVAEEWTENEDGSFTLTLTGDAKDEDGNWVEPGSYVSTLTATDTFAASSSCEIHYTIIEPDIPPSPVDSTYTASASGLDIDFSWNVPSGNYYGTLPADGTLLFVSTSRDAIEALDPADFEDGAVTSGTNELGQALRSVAIGSSEVFFSNVSTSDNAVGDAASGTVAVDSYGAVYYVTCIAYNETDGGRLYADAATIRTVTTSENNPPVITPSEPVDDLSLLVSETLTVDFTIEDPENHDFTVTYGYISAAEQWTLTADGKYSLTLDGDAKDAEGNWVAAGSYSTTITATDSYGASSVCEVHYTIIEPSAAPSSIDTYTASASGLDIDFSWNVPSGNYYGTLPADGTLLCASTSREAVESLVPADFEGNAVVSGTNELGQALRSLAIGSAEVFFSEASTSDHTVGDAASGTVAVDSYDAVYYVTCIAFNDFDEGRLYSDKAETKTVTTAPNNPPVITPSEPVDDLSLLVSETLTVDFTIEDPENHDFTVTYGNISAAEQWTRTSDGKYSLTLDGDAKDAEGNWIAAGSYTTTITATDSYGASSVCEVHYTIIEPETAPSKVDSYTAEADALDINFSWTVPSGNYYGNLPPDGALLFVSSSRSALESLDPAAVVSSTASDVLSPSRRLLSGTAVSGSLKGAVYASEVEVFHSDIGTSDKAVGSAAAGTVPVDGYGTTYYVTIVNYNDFDSGRLYSDKAEIRTVTTASNNPPVITPSQSTDNLTLTVSETRTLTFTITDPDGHDFTSKYTSASIAEQWTKTSEGEYTLTLTGYAKTNAGKYVDTGTYAARLSAADSYGGTSVCTIRYTILDNEAPEATKTMDNALLFLGSSSTDNVRYSLDDCFSDPEGEVLSYAVENTSSVTASVSIYSSNTLVVKGLQSGTATITVTASDPRGLSCSQSFTVVVRDEGSYVILYPNPVTDILHVGIGTTSDTVTSIGVYASTGSSVYDGSVSASAFNPASVDFSSFAPGTYSVRVRYGSTDVTTKVVKVGSGL